MVAPLGGPFSNGFSTPMALYFDLIGWLGAGLLLAAYYVQATHGSRTWVPKYFNVFGSLFLLASALYTQTYPFVVLNFAWLIIAIRVVVISKSSTETTQ